MSFAADVKEELARIEPVCSHCNRAVLAAIVRVEGTLYMSGKGRRRLELAMDIPSVARLAIKLLHEIYSLKTELTMRHNVLHKTPNYLINVPSQPGLDEALKDLGVLDENGLQMTVSPHIVSKQCCAAAYLRGVFMGSGFVSNPKGDFHFEMTVETQEMAESIVDLMQQWDLNPRIQQRRSSYMVYMKSGESILEFLAVVGAHQAALAMENERVIKSVRNDVNRMVNAEKANMVKAANASVDQIYAMRIVLEAYGVEGLAPALQEIIRLRVKYPDATLKELGEYSSPPLSKSAVYHRIRRIEEMAAEIKR